MKGSLSFLQTKTLIHNVICPKYLLHLLFTFQDLRAEYPMILTDQLSNAEMNAIHYTVERTP